MKVTTHHSVPSTSKTTPWSLGAPVSPASGLKGANILGFGVDFAMMDMNLFIRQTVICRLVVESSLGR